MTDRTHDTDDTLDRAAAEIASQQLDAESERQITDRVWEKIAADMPVQPPLRSCDRLSAGNPGLRRRQRCRKRAPCW